MIGTCFAADLIIAVAASIEAWRSTSFIANHFDWVLLQPTNQTLHQSELDQLPRETIPFYAIHTN